MKKLYPPFNGLPPSFSKLFLLSFSFILLAGFGYANPVITTISPSSGPVGTTVTITGSGFSTTTTDNIVYFGAVKATVSAASTTSLTVTVPSGASLAPVSVTTSGAYAQSATSFIVTFPGGGLMFPNSLAAPTVFDIYDNGVPNVAVGDIDGDGKPDVIANNREGNYLNADTNNFAVYRNTSTGSAISLAAPGYFRASTSTISPRSITVADMDNDGKLDLVYEMGGGVHVFRNNSTPGNISFATAVSTSFSSQTTVAVADIDNDGKQDMAVAFPSGSIQLIRNLSTPGNLSFSAAAGIASLPINIVPLDMAAKDLDGDNYPEIVCTSTDNIYVFKNNTSGSSVSFALGFQFESVQRMLILEDLDGDGKTDIVATAASNTANALLNTSSGATLSFSATPIANLGGVNGITASDMNGDGKPDLVFTINDKVYAQINTSTAGNISFAAQVAYNGTNGVQYGVAVCDLNGDSKPEVITGNAIINDVLVYKNVVGNPAITKISPNSAVTGQEVTLVGVNFTGTTAVSFGGVAASSFTIVSADTIVAIIGAGASGAVSVTNAAATTTLAGFVYLQSPTIASFNPASAKTGQTVTITGANFSNITSVKFGDVPAASFTVNSTTSITAVVAAGASGSVSITNVAGTGTLPGFTFNAPPVITAVSPSNAAIGNSVTITGTGFGGTIADNTVFFGPVQATITAANTTTLTAQVPAGAIYRNISLSANGYTTQSALPFNVTFPGIDSINGSTFDRLADLPAADVSGTTVTADFDGDGKTDMIAGTNNSGSSIIIYRNTSVGDDVTFQTKSQSVSSTIKWISAGDLNADGKPDLVMIKFGTGGNRLVVLKNTSTPGNITFTIDNNIVYPAVSPAALTLADIDGDGKTDIIGVNETATNFSIVRTIGENGNLAYAPIQHFSLLNSAIGLRLVAGRLNDDTKPDLAILTNKGLSTFINNSTPGVLQFGAEQVTTISATNRSLASGDVNNDGLLDLVVSYVTAGSLYKVGVLTSSLTPGGFTLSPIYELNASRDPVDILLDDFNGDGRPDIGAVNRNNNLVSVYRNTFNGSAVSFEAFVPYPVGTNPLTMANADFNGDGLPDLCVTNRGSLTITILLNQGGAPFIQSISPKTGGPGTTVTLTGYNFTGITGVSFGNTPAASYTVVSPTTITAVAGEGSDGLVTVSTASTEVTINGFTFVKPSITSFSPAFGKAGSEVIITGINFSAVPDSNTVWFGAVKATVTEASATSLKVLVPNGATWAPLSVTCYGVTTYSSLPFILAFGGNAALDSASFSAKANLNANVSTEGAAIGDFNGDGKPDLVSLNPTKKSISVFTNNSTPGNPSYSSPGNLSFYGTPYDIATGDFNADRKLDLVVGTADSIAIFLNTSTGSTISFSRRNFVTDANASRLAVGDFDRDGKPDVALAHVYSPYITILRNTSTSQNLNFAEITGPAMTGNNPQDLVAADLNADGKPELVVTDYDGLSIAVYRNTSTTAISFAAAYPLTLNGYSFACSVGDLDADGKPEIVVSKLKQNALPALSVLKNNSTTGGSLAFAPAGEYLLDYEAFGTAITDINGDGKPDVIAANGSYNSKVSIFRNTSTGGTISLAGAANYATGNDAVRVLAGDLDGDGKPDVVTANMLTGLYTSTGGLNILYNLAPESVEPPAPDNQQNRLAIKAGPNPFASSITVKIETPLNNAKLQLVDMSGTIIQTWEYKTLPAGSSINVSRPGLRAGFYYLVLATTQGRSILRVIKQ